MALYFRHNYDICEQILAEFMHSVACRTKYLAELKKP